MMILWLVMVDWDGDGGDMMDVNGADASGSGMCIRSLCRLDWNWALALFCLFRRVGYGWNMGLDMV